jgi:thiol-disulfide isomerase/thioredoxin
LSSATLDDLKPELILKSGPVEITRKQIDSELDNVPAASRPAMEKNRLFILEQMATKDILLHLARAEAAKHKDGVTTGTPQAIIGPYLQALASKVAVTDDEVADFYEKNKDMCGGATLAMVKDQLKDYVLQQRQQEVVEKHIQTLGVKTPIAVSAAWVKEQAPLAMDNPVDKARKSGRPSMVDFGSHGCIPCDKMTPILATLEKKYAGKANVLFVPVGEEQILAARYGIQTIPVQIFFDKAGKEVFRHTGFYPQAEIEKKLGELEVK